MDVINIPTKTEHKEQFLSALQMVANTLDYESIKIMANFCQKNGNQSNQLLKQLSTNVFVKKYF